RGSARPGRARRGSSPPSPTAGRGAALARRSCPRTLPGGGRRSGSAAAAAGLGSARGLEADELVRAVAERAQPRLAAAAERDRLAADRDGIAVLVEDPERAA